ncbi:MAG: OsmC family protein [Phycisphaerales bacterium]
MSTYTAEVTWSRNSAPFTDNRYSRAHHWRFDGGADVPASSSPLVVSVPMSDPAGVDPEEAFVASLSSCHMLWFLSLAARKGLVVDEYHDAASGVLGRDAAGKQAMTSVTLHPRVRFSGTPPTPADIAALHRAAHEECFIARSVRCDVRCEPE